MATTSGSVSVFDGASGLMRTILNYIGGTSVTGEIIGAGTGSQTVFAGSLVNSPVSAGQCFFRYTVGAVEYTASTDGAGVVTGTHLLLGSVTYASGAYSLTFSTAPDGSTNVLSDHVYGVAGQDWKIELDQRTRNAAGSEIWPSGAPKEVIISNTGLSGDEKVIVGIREFEYVAQAAYGWNLNSYLFWETGTAWNASQAQHQRTAYNSDWNTYNEHPTFPVVDDTIAYWIYSNKQRIIIVAKVSSRYESLYLGYGRRFGAPSEYPFSLCAIGSIFGERIAASNDDQHAFIAGPYRQTGQDNYGAFIVSPGNAYKFPGDIYFLPYHDHFDAAGGAPDKTSDTKIPLFPCYLMNEPEGEVYMDLDGVYLIANQNMQSEDVVQIGGTDYRVFQDVFRAQYYNYMAIKEV